MMWLLIYLPGIMGIDLIRPCADFSVWILISYIETVSRLTLSLLVVLPVPPLWLSLEHSLWLSLASLIRVNLVCSQLY